MHDPDYYADRAETILLDMTKTVSEAFADRNLRANCIATAQVYATLAVAAATSQRKEP
jgi:hypothetical protein